MRSLIPAVSMLALALFAIAPANAQDTIPNDVTVTFTVCLESAGGSTLPVCVIGNTAELGVWSTGVDLANVEGDVWQGDVTFEAGAPVDVEYKFKKEGCADWEDWGPTNRTLTLPTDGTTSLEADPAEWGQAPGSGVGCGLGATLSEAKTLCFVVCMAGELGEGGDVCVSGNLEALTNYGSGVVLDPMEGTTDAFRGCITIPAGTAVPVNVQYKFKREGCEGDMTWEQVGDDPFANRSVTITDDSPSEIERASNWSDGDGGCDGVVEVDDASWGVLKAEFRD